MTDLVTGKCFPALLLIKITKTKFCNPAKLSTMQFLQQVISHVERIRIS